MAGSDVAYMNGNRCTHLAQSTRSRPPVFRYQQSRPAVRLDENTQAQYFGEVLYGPIVVNALSVDLAVQMALNGFLTHLKLIDLKRVNRKLGRC